MTNTTSHLAKLGDALLEATRTDLNASAAPPRKRWRTLAALGAAAVLVPATALAASELLSTDDVAESLPAGTLALLGTNPTCEAVVDQVEYRCVLDRPPSADPGGSPGANRGVKYEVDRKRGLLKLMPGAPTRDAPVDAKGWLGAAEPTVDATNHVNGGCRALDAAGMTWQCYIGEAAVEKEIISRQFLGEQVRGPGVG